MRIVSIALIALLSFSVSKVSAQKAIAKPDYSFLRPLRFKNRKATVTFKAIYTGAVRNGYYHFFKDLEKKRIINSKKYFTVEKIEGEVEIDGGTCLTFVPDNTSQQYVAAIPQGMNWSFERGLPIYLTCTVYQDIYINKNEPFYVIEKVTYKNEDIPKQQNIGPMVYLDLQTADMNKIAGCFIDYGSKARHLNYLMIITEENQAIIETSTHQRQFFNFVRRTPAEAGYSDLFENENGKLELNINRQIGESGFTIHIGQLILTLNNTTTKINILGDMYDKTSKL